MIHPKNTFNVIKHIILCAFFFGLIPQGSWAQEFNCDVTLNTDQLEGSSFDHLEDLETNLEAYINDYEWSDQEFLEHERLNCRIQIVINSGTSDFIFSAETVFQVQRPIYNTTAQTTSVLISDDTWQFSYPEGKSLIHDEMQFDDLTGYIDFFSYIMLGMDFDTFSEFGGEEYYVQAQNILNLAESANSIGWSRSTNNRRNRNMLVTDLVSPSYRSLRSAIYQYHRHGLDKFINNPEEARQNILDALASIQEAKRRSTSNLLFDVFFDTKYREITAAFTDAPTQIRLEAYDILRQTDQGHLTEYDRLQN
ncbi:DUF4835 family protein [Gracilimonas mengyeensis]|uniref:DUF4835 domain-containing protein n=1 Tax=Gracilimonas mengyeensis TaxID=1302730 RepID=A0A521BZG3_9BACT|nr:DUF4835 family protein [Gracilimonas mengyeensis]SMO52567.1 protein of unknown function [Gracilimonas mengyeensis]